MKKNKATRVKVERGYGPRHAENVKEGEEIPKYAGGEEDLPPGAWGNEPTVSERLRRDFGVGGEMDRKHIEDVLHLLEQFGVGGKKKGLEPVSDEEMMRRYPNLKLKKGKQAVQGNTDTVPAMLTPREAVLNRNAAELAGRGNIEKLNARGNKLAEQGVDLASGGKTMKEKKQKLQGGGDVNPAKKPVGYQNVNKWGNPYGWNPGVRDEGVLGTGGGPTGPPEQIGSLGGPGKPGQNVNQWGVPYGWNPNQGGGVLGQPGGGAILGHPSGGQLGEPAPGPWQGGPQPVKRMPSNNFYPPGQGMQYGEHDIGSGGGTIYGNAAPVQLSAPGGLAELVAAIKAEAKKQGLSAEQMKGLMSAFQGVGGAYNSIGGGESLPAVASGGFQGGISDIGYPPFIGPGMDYHGDKGGWQGPYDPMYTIPVYARGTSSVGPPSFGKPGSIPGVKAAGYQGGSSQITGPKPGWINDEFDLPQGGSNEVPFDPATWADPGPLPPPPPDPNVFVNQYPSNWGLTPGESLTLENRLGWDPSKPTYGFGSGRPTQRGIGTAASIVGNAMFPGLGILTGPLGSMITRMIQRMIDHGASREEIKSAVVQAQGSGGSGGGGGGGKFNFNWPKGLGGFGKPMGYFNIPNYMGRGDFGAPSTIPGSPSGQGTIANTGITFNDVLASGVEMRGRQSVGAPAGGYSPMGTFGPTNIHSRFQPAGMGRGWNAMFGTMPSGDLAGAGGGPHWNVRKF